MRDLKEFLLVIWAAINAGWMLAIFVAEFTGTTTVLCAGAASLVVRAIVAAIYDRQQERSSG